MAGGVKGPDPRSERCDARKARVRAYGRRFQTSFMLVPARLPVWVRVSPENWTVNFWLFPIELMSLILEHYGD